MKKLKVTWSDGHWNDKREMPPVVTLLPDDAMILFPNDQTIVFQDPEDAVTLLMLTSDRLISAVSVETPDA